MRPGGHSGLGHWQGPVSGPEWTRWDGARRCAGSEQWTVGANEVALVEDMGMAQFAVDLTRIAIMPVAT